MASMELSQQRKEMDVLQRAISFHQAGQLHEAEHLYREVLLREPANPDANHNLGVLAMQARQIPAALPHFKIALEANPSQGQYWLSYIDALGQSGQIDAAQQVLQQGMQHGLRGEAVDRLALHLQAQAQNLSSAGENAVCVNELNEISALFAQGQWAEAVVAAQRVTQRFPDNGFGWKALSVALLQIQRPHEALPASQQAALFLPVDAEVQYNLGLALQLLGEMEPAINAFQRALGLNPTMPEAHYYLGSAFHSLGRVDDAIESYRRALENQPASVGTHYALGTVFQEKRDLDMAEASYRQALKINPDFAEAHCSLGITLHALNKRAEAEESYRRALQLLPDYAEAHSNLGALFYDLQQIDNAIRHYRRAISIKPEFADAHYNLGVALAVAGQAQEEVIICYRQALQIKPDHLEALRNLGAALHKNECFAEAEASYRSALAIKPEDVEALSGLGIVLSSLNRLDEAEASYRRALDIQPDNSLTYCNMGVILNRLNRLAEAEGVLRTAIHIKPGFADAYYNLGVTLKYLGRLQEAESAYRAAIKIKPDYAEAYCNLGVILYDLDRMDEAEESYREALKLNPNYPDAYCNIGVLKYATGYLDQAEKYYRLALQIKPDFIDAIFNLSLTLLKSGRMKEGWEAYEARYLYSQKNANMLVPPAEAALLPPRWQGECLKEKSLLIWPEQGFGDEIQFVRYLPLIRSRGVQRVVLVCRPALHDLFSVSGLADENISLSDWHASMISHFDFWCNPASLPMLFDTTVDDVPAPIPYLKVVSDKISALPEVLTQAKFRVGLVWKGNPDHVNDAHRSIPSLKSLAPLWSVSDVTFFSLQKGAGEDEAALPPAGQPIIDLCHIMKDFSDSAAIISQLDLLISVDTSVVHLAGALGIPCWVLLPKQNSDWRWLDNRADSPWYPSKMRLFRQAQPKEWNSLIAELACALKVAVKDTQPVR